MTELLKGPDLFTYLESRNFEITESKACGIIHCLAAALYYMHSYGITHRDIKLENIVFEDDSENSEVKILDFGLSKIIGPSEECFESCGKI